jgi:Ca2+-binding EF-hand superfamily protein
MNIQDQMLMAYIDKIFDKYDTDKSGTLDQNEMTNFFN